MTCGIIPNIITEPHLERIVQLTITILIHKVTPLLVYTNSKVQVHAFLVWLLIYCIHFVIFWYIS